MKSIIVKSLLVLLLAIFIALYYEKQTLYTSPPPNLPLQWWGVGEERISDPSVIPFKINISEEVLTDLKQRLNMVRPFEPPLEGINFQYGFNTNYLKTVLEFWKNKYSWKDREVYLNTFPQFTTEVAGLKIHFIHVKPTVTPGVKVIPLLISHGWPGSVLEFYDILPLLTTPRPGMDFVFEVIAPAIPGYGFSEGTSKPGLGVAQVAVIFGQLMERLKFDKYFVQGGDWGSAITMIMSQLYPDRVRGLHSNLCFVDLNANFFARLLIGSIFPSLIAESHEVKFLFPASNLILSAMEETGYIHIQSTKPDTVGVALNESPIGLAAYILEKFSTGTNINYRRLADGGLSEKYDMARLLDNVMLYWVTNSKTTAMRLYSETLNIRQWNLGLREAPVNVPAACARFPHEIMLFPTSILKLKFKSWFK